jgi:orotidine-5'-phosphate decarboxylase
LKKSSLIVALDYPDAAQALAMAAQLDPARVILKVGKELFVAAGPALVEKIQRQGFRIFLDLKFHDIPNTVAGAVKVAASMGVWMVNVHASGGRAMLEAAANVLAQQSKRPLLTAVTVLTSLGASDLKEVGVERELDDQVAALARLTQACGLDGVVCSAREAVFLRGQLPPPFCLVTPGIRPQGSSTDDQARTLTPEAACALGVDYLVIGRPITQAADPAAMVAKILQQMSTGTDIK